MKGKTLICIVALLLALVFVSPGCASTKGEVAKAEGAVDMMKKVPKDSEFFWFVDIDTFRNDVDLEEVYIDLEQSLEAFADLASINANAVDRFVMTGGFEYSTLLFEGDFDLDEVRDKLEGFDYDVDEYRGVEVWGAEGILIALVSNKLVIHGPEDAVQACIEVIREGDASLYDDRDFRDIMERLPSGILVQVIKGFSPFPLFAEYGDGFQVGGISGVKKDEHSVVFAGVSKFENRDSASAAVDAIESDLENNEFDDWIKIDVTQDAEFIVVYAEQDIEGAFK